MLRPGAQSFAVEPVTLNTRDRLNVAPLPIGDLSAATVPLQLAQHRVFRRVDVKDPTRQVHTSTVRQSLRVEGVVAGDGTVPSPEGGMAFDGFSAAPRADPTQPLINPGVLLRGTR